VDREGGSERGRGRELGSLSLLKGLPEPCFVVQTSIVRVLGLSIGLALLS